MPRAHAHALVLQGESGGLDSPSAWLGFGLSVTFMLAGASMYICLQVG